MFPFKYHNRRIKTLTKISKAFTTRGAQYWVFPLFSAVKSATYCKFPEITLVSQLAGVGWGKSQSLCSSSNEIATNSRSWRLELSVYLQRIKVKPMKRSRPPSLHNFDQTGINGRSLEFRAHHSEPPATGALVHHSVLCTVHSPAQCTSHRYNATQQPPIYTTLPPVRWWFMVCMQVHSIIIQ